MKTANLFASIPAVLPEELIEALVEAGPVRIERIVSKGHRLPDGSWYDQDRAEWVVLLKGRARLEFASGSVLALHPGDHLTLPAHEKHRVAWTDPDTETVWLAVHFDDP